ncbi:MAG: hypothetical protein KDI37_14140 [Xanthomonadales bacterium]|nr:hypothetical protein [Xanthomonadales bacterium]MCB1642867.1 hypothetical protein [Xanthomonadales bacterium]
MLTRLSNPEISTVAVMLGHELPGLYRKLLIEEGFGKAGDVRIYHPAEIEDIYKHHFDDPEELFRRWFPFGCNERLHEIWVVDPITETAASIWHETNPDDYDDEEWLSYEDWICRYLP